MKGCLSGDFPTELADEVERLEIDPNAAARQHLGDAKRVPPSGWEDALKPTSKLDSAVMGDDLVAVEHRLELLEERQRLLELWMAQDRVLSEGTRCQLREATAECKAIWDLLRKREERQKLGLMRAMTA